jgi:hypothetical protein
MSLYIKPEVHDISVLHDIIFSFYIHFSGFFTGCFRSVLDIVVIFDDFCPDKTFFEIGVNDTCALRSFTAFKVGPCPNFLYPGGKICFEV